MKKHLDCIICETSRLVRLCIEYKKMKILKLIANVYSEYSEKMKGQQLAAEILLDLRIQY